MHGLEAFPICISDAVSLMSFE